MELTGSTELKNSNKKSADAKLQAVKKVMHSFAIALKAYALYPQNHGMCKKSIQSLAGIFDETLNRYGELRLFVEKESMIFQDEKISQKNAAENNLAALLFRDGIQWIEFQKGISLSEINAFFKILKQYKDLPDEAEGDIVTALWEENLNHIRYEAADVLWDDKDLIDFSNINNEQKIPEKQPEKQDDKNQDTLKNIESGILKNHTLWNLTLEEKKMLQKMVLLEENWNLSGDVFDVLIVILEEQSGQEDFSIILEFLKEELRSTLEQTEFNMGFKLVKRIRKIMYVYKKKKPWALPLLEKFFLTISSQEFLDVFNKIQEDMKKISSEKLQIARQFLICLNPLAVVPLGEILIQISSPRIQKIFMEAIGSLSAKNLDPLEKLLQHPDDKLVWRMVCILRYLKGEKPVQLLFTMLRHSSQKVREETIKAIFNKGTETFQKLFQLIEDPCEDIRKMILNYFGKKRDVKAEQYLRNYLEKGNYKLNTEEHILACYKTLGRCGSSLSITFLEQELLHQGWLYFIGIDRDIRRLGAAIALWEIKTEEAEDILYKASKNLYPGIKNAYRNSRGM